MNLQDRSFLTLEDFSGEEIRGLLDLSRELKAAKQSGTEEPRLRGKNIALIFEKASTRTRCAFEVAAYDQGAHATYLGPSGSQIGHKESMKDTARVLGRMYDAIEYRGYAQELVETLAEHAGVPVYNGLTDEYHPTQILADVLTMTEHCDKPLEDISYCYLGDARNNYNDSKAWCIRDIQNKAKNVVWLNPESPSAWGFGDSVMDRYMPYCDVVEECRNLRQLSRIVDDIVL